MTDVFDSAKRSQLMSRIRSKNTKPELFVRKLLYGSGLRYRLNSKELPGHPDIVLKKWRTTVFVNGCFWHVHQGCRSAATPASNQIFWKEKLQTNRERDIRNYKLLREQGWRVLVVWECACKAKFAEELRTRMVQFIRGIAEEFLEIGGYDLMEH